MKISHIWFDIGYTLLKMKREVTYQQVLKLFGEEVPIDSLEIEFHLVDKIFMREYPGVFMQAREVYMPWFLGVLNYRLGVNIDVSEADKRWQEIQSSIENYWIPFDNVHEVLAEMKSQSLHMGVISNWDETAQGILEQHCLTKYFDHCIISSEVGINKPDPAIFHLAMQKANVEPQCCLYVGDNYYDDAIGSREVGMEAVILNRFDNLGVEEIKDVPIIQNLKQLSSYL